MASPNQEQALYEMSQILQGDKEAREDFEYRACMATFGFWGPGSIGTWKSNLAKDMMCIEIYGERYFFNNLKVAMLQEAVGIGPQRYCVVFNQAPHFYSKLKLVMSCLPNEKMFLYPAGTDLTRHFNQGRRAIWARVLMR